MKTLIATSVLAALLASGVAVMAQKQNDDYLGLPGDNLNLYAVMTLFQESKTLEEFERSLNDENSRINNLDLNGDNLIDYISVFDNVTGNVHNIVLQVAVNKRERQDVAVFTVERDRAGNVFIQLTGDEALYGSNYIIEPVYDDSVYGQIPNPGYTGNASTINGRNITVIRTTSYEIAAWPIITYIYLPDYITWRSSWYWGYYPSYWNPWRPYYWHYYYGYHSNWYNHYYAHYRLCDQHHHNYWNDYYYHPHHSHSAYVSMNIKDGHYKSTYSHPEERKKGETLYSTTHRDNSSQRTKNISMSDQNRRSASEKAEIRQSVSTSKEPSRRSESSAGRTLPGTTTETYRKYLKRTDPVYSTRTGTKNPAEKKSSEPVRSTATSSDRKSGGTTPGHRMSEYRPSADSRISANSRPSGANPRESISGKSSAPARMEAKAQPSQSRSRDSKSDVSQSRSKEFSLKKESSRR
jgi:hypothetical protein